MSDRGGGERVVVVAAIIERHGRILVSRRESGVHLEGMWEFPGGKVEEGEGHEAALRRELREELGIEIEVGEKMEEIEWDYPERRVHLHFYRCQVRRGEPRPLCPMELRWVSRRELRELSVPPADRRLIGRLSQRTTPSD